MQVGSVILLSGILLLTHGCGSANNVKAEKQRAEAASVEKALEAERDAKRQACSDKLDSEFYSAVKSGKMPRGGMFDVPVKVKVTSMFGQPIEETIKDAKLISISGSSAIVDVYWSYMDIEANRAPLGTNRLQAAMNASPGGTDDKKVKVPVSSLMPYKDQSYGYSCTRI